MRKSFSGKKGNYPYVFHLNTSDIVNKLGFSGTGRSLLYVKNRFNETQSLVDIEVRSRTTALLREPYDKRREIPEISTIPNKDAAMERRCFSHFNPSQAWLQFHLLWLLPLLYPSLKSSFLHPHLSLWISV